MGEQAKPTMRVFDHGWRAQLVGAGLPPIGSWAREVANALEQDGAAYLDTLALWFQRFPLVANKQRWELKIRLESLTTADHLGAVNELAWYVFMRRFGLEAEPVPVGQAPRPDFRVTDPAEFFVEVSTLNVSDAEKSELRQTGGVDLDQKAALRRVLRKAGAEKAAQVAYAAVENRPCVLVLFDYSFWSGLATDRYQCLASALLDGNCLFPQLPTALSAIVYAERRVCAGRPALSLRRSAIYYNPSACHPVAAAHFDMLQQFACGIGPINSKVQEDWIYL